MDSKQRGVCQQKVQQTNPPVAKQPNTTKYPTRTFHPKRTNKFKETNFFINDLADFSSNVPKPNVCTF
jgi:hypothetical protein